MHQSSLRRLHAAVLAVFCVGSLIQAPASAGINEKGPVPPPPAAALPTRSPEVISTDLPATVVPSVPAIPAGVESASSLPPPAAIAPAPSAAAPGTPAAQAAADPAREAVSGKLGEELAPSLEAAGRPAGAEAASGTGAQILSLIRGEKPAPLTANSMGEIVSEQGDSIITVGDGFREIGVHGAGLTLSRHSKNPAVISNPAEVFEAALGKAIAIAAARGLGGEQIYFGAASARLPLGEGGAWKFTFYLSREKDPREMRTRTVKALSFEVSRAADGRVAFGAETLAPWALIPHEIVPFPFDKDRPDVSLVRKNAWNTTDEALAKAQGELKDFGQPVKVSFHFEALPESGDTWLWYSFTDRNGSVARVEADNNPMPQSERVRLFVRTLRGELVSPSLPPDSKGARRRNWLSFHSALDVVSAVVSNVSAQSATSALRLGQKMQKAAAVLGDRAPYAGLYNSVLGAPADPARLIGWLRRLGTTYDESGAAADSGWRYWVVEAPARADGSVPAIVYYRENTVEKVDFIGIKKVDSGDHRFMIVKDARGLDFHDRSAVAALAESDAVEAILTLYEDRRTMIYRPVIRPMGLRAVGLKLGGAFFTEQNSAEIAAWWTAKMKSLFGPQSAAPAASVSREQTPKEMSGWTVFLGFLALIAGLTAFSFGMWYLLGWLLKYVL